MPATSPMLDEFTACKISSAIWKIDREQQFALPTSIIKYWSLKQQLKSLDTEKGDTAAQRASISAELESVNKDLAAGFDVFASRIEDCVPPPDDFVLEEIPFDTRIRDVTYMLDCIASRPQDIADRNPYIRLLANQLRDTTLIKLAKSLHKNPDGRIDGNFAESTNLSALGARYYSAKKDDMYAPTGKSDESQLRVSNTKRAFEKRLCELLPLTGAPIPDYETYATVAKHLLLQVAFERVHTAPVEGYEPEPTLAYSEPVSHPYNCVNVGNDDPVHQRLMAETHREHSGATGRPL